MGLKMCVVKTLPYNFTLTVSFLALTLPAGAQDQQKAIELNPIVITGEDAGATASEPVQADGYVAISGRSATKTNTAVKDVQQSTSTVTQQQLQDRATTSLLDVLSYTPGTYVGQYGFDPRFDGFKIRGIDATYTGVFRDGLRQLSSPNGLFRFEPYGVEAVNIVRGPSGSVYGNSSTGGIVDIISKRPSEETLREIELQTGSYQRKQGAFDFTGAVNDDKTFLYRLTGVWRNADTELGDAVKDDRFYIAPAFTWQPDNDTRLTVLSGYMDSTTGGTAAYVNEYDPVTGKSIGATHEFAGDPRFNDFRQKQGWVGYELDQRLTDNVTLHQRARYSSLAAQWDYSFQNYPGTSDDKNNGLVADTYLEAELQTGAVEHKLIGGLDISYARTRSFSGTGSEPFTPDHIYVPAYNKEDRQKQSQIGIYLQDQIKFDAWRLTLGLRHDWSKSDLETGVYGEALSAFSRNDSETTGRASVGYETDFGVTPYVSYGTSFVTNTGVLKSDGDDAVRQQAVPTLGRQVEAGMKYVLPNTNAYINAAVFRLDQDNATIFEASSGINQQIQLDLRSSGFELEGGTTLDNGLSLIAAYTYNNVKIRRLTAETEGNTLNASPYHTASLWADYSFVSGALTGLGVGAGLRYTGSSFGDNSNTPVLDNKARLLLDAGLRYDLVNLAPSLDGMRLQVNASNLLNEVKQVCTSGFCYWDEGRKITASMRYRF